MCHAGHCDWHLPHSVQLAISSKPFQVISPDLPIPNTSSSAGFSKSTAFPFEMISLSAPSEGRPSIFRLKKILNGAKKRCQATPIFKLIPITTNQSIEIIILVAATILIRFSICVLSKVLKKFTDGALSR